MSHQDWVHLEALRLGASSQKLQADLDRRNIAILPLLSQPHIARHITGVRFAEAIQHYDSIQPLMRRLSLSEVYLISSAKYNFVPLLPPRFWFHIDFDVDSGPYICDLNSQPTTAMRCSALQGIFKRLQSLTLEQHYEYKGTK